MLKIRFLCLCICCVLIYSANAKETFSTNSIALLWGNTYAVDLTPETDDNQRMVVTLSHASENTWGDVFTFLDITQSLDDRNNQTLYGEFSPRFKLSPLFGGQEPKVAGAPILLATTLEYGVNAVGASQINPLVGIGTNLSVPFFDFLQLNYYRRFNQVGPNSWQLTPVWQLPVNLGEQDFIFSGWLDWEIATHGVEANIHTQAQFRWDLGKSLLHKPKTLYVGTEYVYWRNKFGIEGVTESVWQAMVRVFF